MFVDREPQLEGNYSPSTYSALAEDNWNYSRAGGISYQINGDLCNDNFFRKDAERYSEKRINGDLHDSDSVRECRRSSLPGERAQTSERKPETSRLKFQYQELPSDSSAIRIIKLLPGSPADELKCVLEYDSVDSTRAYEAISYVWGDETDTEFIVCEEMTLQIRRNLSDALFQLRHHAEPLRLWADAICINQESDDEKNRQVPLMRTIFERAEKVLIWLGHHGSENAAKVFDIARKISDEQLDNDLPLDTSIWRGFSILFSQPWFWRIWCFQEVVLARKAEVMWGEIRIDWQHLGKAARWIRGTGCRVMQKFELAGVYNATLMYNMSVDAKTDAKTAQKSFLRLLMLTRQFESTKSVDKIYALLGIKTIDASPDRGDFFLEVDYRTKTKDVYEEFAKTVINKTRDTNLLSAVQHGPHIDGKLQSWVPQWDRQYMRSILSAGFPDIGFSASLHLKKSPPSFQDGRLVVHGTEIDTVARTSSTILERSTFDSKQQLCIRYLWTEMVEPLRTYQERLDLVTPFCWTLTAGKDWIGDSVDDKKSHMADFVAFMRQIPEADSKWSLPEMLRGRTGSVQGVADRYKEALQCCVCSRRFFVTTKGYIGIGPQCMQDGDKVCVLSGAILPFILRASEDTHKLVGETYIHGIMGGEACKPPERGPPEELSAFHLS